MDAGFAEIDHREFAGRFKLIRKERDSHFGEHQLMKDTRTRRRVIVKNQSFADQTQLDEVMDGINSLSPLRECQHLVLLLGYSVSTSSKIVSLVYEYHDSTLEESMKSSSLHSKPPSDKSMLALTEGILSALKHLYSLGLNHLDIRPANILEQNKESLNMTYKLLFTNYTVDAVIQLKNLDTSLESYYLSTSQLQQLQSNSVDNSTQEDRYKSDMQSLGLVVLHVGTLAIKDKYYTYGGKDEIKLNEEVVMRRLKEFRKQYSKKTVKMLEALLEGRQTTAPNNNHEENSAPNLFEPQPNTGGKSHLGSSRVSEEDKADKTRKILVRNSQHNIEQKSQGRPSGKKDKDREKERDKTERMSASQLKKYQTSLDEIEKKIIYKPRTKELLPGMQEKKYSDNSKYVGELSSTMQRQGKGIYYYAEGDVYAGEWQENTLQGYGIYLFSNGEKYEGEVQKGVKSGKGEYIYSNNNRYVGDWLNDRKHGFGTYYYHEKGDVYEGSFIDGSKEGHGRYTFANGDYFEGSFHRGERSGEGTIVYSSGTTLNGSFLNGEISGEAKIRYYNNDASQVFFVKSQKQGNGSYNFEDGTLFEGTYNNGCKSGPSQISYGNGDHYKGNLCDGLREGYGVYTYYSGVQYQGNWFKNMKNGEGTVMAASNLSATTVWSDNTPGKHCKIVYPNGDQYEGQHKSLTIRHGRGTYTARSGDTLTGEFRDGKFEHGHITDRFGSSFVYP